LTVYFGGYPADAPAEQRRLDAAKVVSACELFLSRLAKDKVTFGFQGELALVDNINDARVLDGEAGPPRTLAAGEPADGATASARSRNEDRAGGLWEV
jgi:hypothetical protein